MAIACHPEAPGNRAPSLLDWLLVLPLLVLASAMAVGWIVWNLSFGSPHGR
jgi:hypothetical protein